MRLGLFGGSFDPVHNGHLLLAKCCLEQAQLDEVWFVPSAVQPLKPNGPIASNTERVAMLRLAIEGLPQFKVSTLEIDRGGLSYTAETLRRIHEQRPDETLFFLMGADTLHDLPRWREPEEVLRLATPLVVHRPGEPKPEFNRLSDLVDAGRLKELRNCVVEMPATDLSSSALRERLAAGESCAKALPRSVAEWITANRLYQKTTT